MKITVFWDMILFFYLEAGGSRFVLNVGKYIPEKKRPYLNENSQLGQTASGPRLELGISQIRIKCANHSTMTFSDAEVSNGMLSISNLMKLPAEPLVYDTVSKWKQENVHMHLINRVPRKAQGF
jgi:hypothetical protein